MPYSVNSLRGCVSIVFVSILTCVSALSAFAQTNEIGGIVWEKDFEVAQKRARDEMKPMLLDFTATWCKPCLLMDKEFWVLDSVAGAVKPFIAVKVDFDKNRKIARQFDIEIIPHVVFTDPLANVIATRRGFSPAKVTDLFAILEKMPKDFSPLKPYYDQVEADASNGVAQLKIADAYRNAKMFQLSNKFYKNALPTPALRQDLVNRERVKAIIGVNHYLSDEFDEASKAIEDYLKEFEKGANREAVLLYGVLNGIDRKKKKEAQKYFDQLKSEFPESKYLERATQAMNAKRG